MTANPNQHWKGENHTSVSRFVTSPNVLHLILLAWDKITMASSITHNQWLWTERRTLMRCTERFNIVHRLVIAWKTANISGHHHWFPWEIASEKWAQKFHTDDVSLPSSGYWRIISIEFLRSFLRGYFAEEPVASWNVGCWIWPVIIPPSSAGMRISEFAQQCGRNKSSANVTNVTGPLLSRFVVICT